MVRNWEGVEVLIGDINNKRSNEFRMTNSHGYNGCFGFVGVNFLRRVSPRAGLSRVIAGHHIAAQHREQGLLIAINIRGGYVVLSRAGGSRKILIKSVNLRAARH